MKTLLIFAVFFTLSACSPTKILKLHVINQSPNGMTVVNITKTERVKAYRSSEAHCSKYSKVPRMIKLTEQDQHNGAGVELLSMKFECIRPTK